MGGKALKHVEGIRRYESSEFYALAETLVPKLKECLGTEVHLVESYRLKETFGDMDILVLSDGSLTNVMENVRRDFEPKEIVHNGPVYSFDCQGLQIDLILTKSENWETAKVFFAYNDLGNLMGKIYHKFGLKYGFDGVKYIHRIGNERVLGEVVVTKDMRKAFEFIGLSWDRFLEGFDKIEDVFDFVVMSKYFNPDSFSFDSLNAIDKKRNKKRANFKLFLEYVSGTGTYSELEPITTGYNGFKKDKSEYLESIYEFFGRHIEDEVERFKELEVRRVEVASKYNGKLIMEKFPHLEGQSLGDSMKRFKDSFSSKHELEQFVLDNDEEMILRRFEEVLASIPSA